MTRLTLPTALKNALAIGVKTWTSATDPPETRYYLTKSRARKLSGVMYEVRYYLNGEEVDAFDALAFTDTSYYLTPDGEVRASRHHPRAKQIAALIQAELDKERPDA